MQEENPFGVGPRIRGKRKTFNIATFNIAEHMGYLRPQIWNFAFS